MTTYVISSGHTKTLTLSAGDRLQVLSGGDSYASMIGSGAIETVSSGGASAQDQVLSGGALVMSSGARVVDLTVSAGGSTSGAGELIGYSYDYGLVSGALVEQSEENGGLALTVESGGVADNVGVYYALVVVSGGGRIDDANLEDHGSVIVEAGASASGTSVGFPGGQPYYSPDLSIQGGSASATMVYANGVEDVSDGGTDLGSIIQSGGQEVIGSGGTASDVTVHSGGALGLYLGGVAKGAVVSSGGAFDLGVVRSGQTLTSPGGPLTSVVAMSGVTAEVGATIGLASDAAIQKGGTVVLKSGVFSGQQITVAAGGKLIGPGAVGNDFQTLVVLSGTASGVQLGELGVGVGDMYVEHGGVAYKTRVAVGDLGINPGGVASATLLEGVLSELDVYSGGAALATTVMSNATMVLSSHGVASGLAVSSGGMVEGGGVLKGLTVDRGAVQGVGIGSGASLVVSSGGLASGVTMSSGAELTVQAGGIVSNAIVDAGSTLAIAGAAVFSEPGAAKVAGALDGDGVIFNVGPGTLVLSAAAAFRGTIVNEAGTVELAGAGGLGGGTVQFGTGDVTKTLQLDTPAQPASGAVLKAALVDFDASSDGLDLRGLTFVAGAQATLAGSTLVLKDGGYTAKFRLRETKAATYVAVSDGHGGTLIEAQTGAADAMIQSIAAWTPAGAAPVVQASAATPPAGPLIAVKHG